jgi:IS5 family transposase
VPKRSAEAQLLHGREELVYGDADYQGIDKRTEIADKSITFRVAMGPGKRRALSNTPDGHLLVLVETAKAHIRAKGEDTFCIIKQLLGLQKARLSGMTKNHYSVNMLAALTNLYLALTYLLATG